MVQCWRIPQGTLRPCSFVAPTPSSRVVFPVLTSMALSACPALLGTRITESLCPRCSLLPKPHPPHSLLERVRWSRLLSWRPLCGLVASRRSSVTGFCPRRNEIADHDPFLVEHRPRDDGNWSSSKVSQYTSSESAWDGSAVAIEAFPSASLLILLASRLPFCAHGVVAGGSAQSAAVDGVLEQDTASHNTDLRVRPIRTKVM